jgi:hypothetical protein
MTMKAASRITFFVLILLCGCSSANKPTPQNFITALNTYYQDRNDCLFPQGRKFPYEVAPGDKAKQEKQQMDSLYAAGMFTRLEDRDLHVDSYSLTPVGQRYAPRFCYGHRQVTSVESFTPPAPRNGFTETDVTYHYTEADVPVWARTADIVTAFPKLSKDLSPSPTDTMTLASAGVDWQVPQ